MSIFSLYGYSCNIVLTVTISLFLHFVILKLINYFKKRDTNNSSAQNKKKSVAFAKRKILEESNDPEHPDEEDYTISALPEDLHHVPFQYTKLSDTEMIQRSKEFFESMNKRRSVRVFSKEMIPEEVIRNIIKTAGTSPSGAHTEPWTFVVVKEDSMKRQIREVVEEEEYINYTRRMGRQWTADLKPFKTDWNKPYLTDAPYVILVFKQLYSFTESGARKNHYYNEISVAIATGMLLMAIQNAGLVTLTSTPLQCGGRLRDILGRPDSERLTILLPVGKPADGATVPDLSRKTFDEICVEI